MSVDEPFLTLPASGRDGRPFANSELNLTDRHVRSGRGPFWTPAFAHYSFYLTKFTSHLPSTVMK
jgi:hypothetical protein